MTERFLSVRASRHAARRTALSVIVAAAAASGSAALADATSAPSARMGALSWQKLGSETGRPLIFLPALGFPGSSWVRIYTGLEKSRPIYVVTFAGSAWMGSCQPPCLDGMVQAVHGLIESEHLDHPVLVGHLLGAHVAFRVAGQYPDEIGGVFCLPVLSPRVPYDQREAAAREVESLYQVGSDEMWESVIRMEASRAVHDAHFADQITDTLRHADRPTYGRVLGELTADRIEEWLPKIRAPVLLLVPVTRPQEAPDPSMRDMRPNLYARYRVEMTRMLYPGIAKCDASFLRNARTFPIYEHAEQVAAALDRFLNKLEKPGARWGNTLAAAAPGAPGVPATQPAGAGASGRPNRP